MNIKDELKILKTILTQHDLKDVADGIEQAFLIDGLEGVRDYCGEFSPFPELGYEYAKHPGRLCPLLGLMQNVAALISLNPDKNSIQASPKRSQHWADATSAIEAYLHKSSLN